MLKWTMEEIVEPLTDEMIEQRILELERKYGMSRGTFLVKFNTGQLGDSFDFLDWATMLDLLATENMQKITV